MEMFMLRVSRYRYLYGIMSGLFLIGLVIANVSKINEIQVLAVAGNSTLAMSENELENNSTNTSWYDENEKDSLPPDSLVGDDDKTIVFVEQEKDGRDKKSIDWSEIELSEKIIREKFMSLEVLSYFDYEKIDRYQEYILDNEDKSYKQCIIEVNVGIDQDFFTDVSEVENPDDLLVLVNKFHCLPADYEPEDLVELPSEYAKEGIMLREVAAEALDKMRQDALKLGYEINVVSAYRSYETQEKLYTTYAERSGTKEADSYSARPGYSEHQTGLAVDLQAGVYKYNEFEKTPESEYVTEHAHEYGFILRYQKGKRYITGYIPEAWHIRYVGVEVATQIYEEGITYEEYCVMYKNK